MQVREWVVRRVYAVRPAWLRLCAAARKFLIGRRGVTTLEYGLIAVAVIGIVAMGIGLMGGAFKDMFEAVESDLQGAADQIESALGT